MAKDKIIERYNEKDGIASCTLTYRSASGQDIVALGTALCHPQDQDMKSQITGEFIARGRAVIAMAQRINAEELKPGLVALQHLLSTMDHGGYDMNSKEIKRIKKEIKNFEDDIKYNKSIIEEERKLLREYIDGKEEVYQEIRAKEDNK